MATKRQQTMAKLTRERNVREKRERKAEKKAAAAAERARLAERRALGLPDEDVEAPHEPDDDTAVPSQD
jgi:hypothetical protein